MRSLVQYPYCTDLVDYASARWVLIDTAWLYRLMAVTVGLIVSNPISVS